MTQTIKKNLNDYAWARWTAMVLIALMMLFAHMFVDVISPIKELMQIQRGWTSDIFGTFAGSEYLLNTCGFLIVAGIILDKMGIRFTGILSGSVMVIGAAIKFYAVSDFFSQDSALYGFLNSFWTSFPPTAKLASLGFMIFGCGVEMAGVTVSKAIAKWFRGKEMALAMGLEMAIARLGVFAVFRLSPYLSTYLNETMPTVVTPVLACTILLLIGLIAYTVFTFMDKTLDKQMGNVEEEEEEQFKVSDIGKLFTSKTFLIVAGLCVLYYSAIFPFQKFATGMLESNLGLPTEKAAGLFSWFPIGAMVLTPFLGAFLDNKGKGATMLMFGAIIMIACHLSFAFLLPAFPSKTLALVLIVVLGVSFSLVPASLWPSVPKIIDPVILGSAYSLIFWIQNIGLCLVPLLIGVVLKSTGGYVAPMCIFASFGVLAFIMSFFLKVEDKKKGYGLELPNIKK